MIERLKMCKEEAEQKVKAHVYERKQSQTRIESVFPAYEIALLDRYLKYKGNIRVFIRARPILPNDFKAYGGTPEEFKQIESQLVIPNSQQIEIC